jgi:serine/threonine protein phosphatase 1
MKYFVVSDVHGFFTEMKNALEEKGFFENDENKLIVCGDMMDRGDEAVKMQDFMYDLFKQDRLIFVKGNHESLMQDMIQNLDQYLEQIIYGYSHHISNGTWSTALQLAEMTETEAIRNIEKFVYRVINSKYYKELIPAAVNYFEIDKYIFVHSFIPLDSKDNFPNYNTQPERLTKMENWRHTWESDWEEARWYNPYKLAEAGLLPDKTLVFGHYHTSYPRYYYEYGKEWGKLADFSPYYGEGYIGIDACTAYSNQVNVLVIED